MILVLTINRTALPAIYLVSSIYHLWVGIKCHSAILLNFIPKRMILVSMVLPGLPYELV